MKAWAESLGGISFPLLSDFSPQGAVAKRYGVKRKEGFSERAIFVVDKFGIIRYIDVHDITKKPNNRVLFTEISKCVKLQDCIDKDGGKPDVKTRKPAKSKAGK